MNLVIEQIKNRRSTRNFMSKQIEESDLQEILECGLLAPSGMNEQGIHFTVIQQKDILDQLKKMVGRDFMYGAPTIIVVHCDVSYRYAQNDGSVAIENMYIAANALGLGACWLNQLKDFYDTQQLNDLGFKKQIIPGCLALGYQNEQSSTREVHTNRIHYIK